MRLLFRRSAVLSGVFALFASAAACAQSAHFDLTGPQIEVRVTRGSATLPIASVPNLQPGDRLWLHPDLPRSQSVHYLLVVAFLRGTTNPPPDSWFTKAETWNRQVREEGITVTVPPDAEQALLFLAPVTGGDFSTLRSAVEGRPGVFVRASQDLNEAGFEQGRIEKYAAEIKQVPPADPRALMEHSNLLARTLNLRPDDACFKRPADQQYNCLAQSGTETLLNDGHGQTVVSSLTSGPGSDFIHTAANTQLAGGGAYSAYVGAVVDLVRIMSGLHTAQYQYIPAIASPDAQKLNLRLNTPPSFHNPKSVIVIGLPAVQSSVPPPLRPADPNHVTCLLAPNVTLPVEGAPLVFSTAFAHNLTLDLKTGSTTRVIPLDADAFRGGLVPATGTAERKVLSEDGAAPARGQAVRGAQPQPSTLPHPANAVLTGTVRGAWGFDPFRGPTLKLQDRPGQDWQLSGTSGPIIAGQKEELRLTSTGTACIESISFDDAEGHRIRADWTPAGKADTVRITLPSYAGRPGELKLDVKQFGDPSPAVVALQSFSKPAEVASANFHEGDRTAKLSGSQLGEVRELRAGGAVFAAPETSQPAENGRSMTMALKGTAPATLRAGSDLNASLVLDDGRTLDTVLHVLPARPAIQLLGKGFVQNQPSAIQLSEPNDLPLNSRVTFSLRSEQAIARDASVEVASPDGSLSTRLTLASGSLVLQDAHTLLAEFDPKQTFGASAFGPIQLRMFMHDGMGSDWLPLGILVRLPVLTQLQCSPASAAKTVAPCSLSGSGLFLIAELSPESEFADPTEVPNGFVGSTLPVPRPSGDTLYLKLRDDPTATDSLKLPLPGPGPGASAAVPVTAVGRLSK